MSDMKCPFCQQELETDCIKYVYFCKNKKCKETKDLIGSAKMWNKIGGLLEDVELARHNEYVWHTTCEEISIKRNTIQQELIRTRKALDVAVDALNKIDMRCQNTVRNHLERATIRGELCDISFYAKKAIDDIDNLDKITALEQKE